MDGKAIAMRGHDMSTRGQAPIAAEFEDSLQSFQSLCSAMEANPSMWESECRALSETRTGLSKWGEETGAVNRSLDRALNKSSGLQARVLALLEDLNKALQSILELVQITAEPLLSPAITEMTGFGYFDLRTNLNRSFEAMSISETSMQSTLDDVADTFNRLRRMAPSLQHPFPRDYFQRDALPNNAQIQIEQASRMFPKAPVFLKQRLGSANWERQQYLHKMRAQMQAKRIPKDKIASANTPRTSGQDVVVDKGVQARAHGLSQKLDQLIPRERAIFSRVASDSETASNSGTIFSKPESRTEYTGTSVADSLEFGPVWRRLVVPSPPVALRSGVTFQCPYCAEDIGVPEAVATHSDWVEHVFGDLEPYMCTAESCSFPTMTFRGRPEWFRHELECHRVPKVWFCQSCAEELQSQASLEQHLRSEHDFKITSEQLSLMTSFCERYSEKPLEFQICPLCSSSSATAEEFCAHMADHLEQLALTSVDGEYSLEEEYPPSPRSTISFGNRNKLSDLQDLVFDETRGILDWATAIRSPMAYDPTDGIAPGQSDYHLSQVNQRQSSTRPSMAQRGPSYSYMAKVRDLKTAEAGPIDPLSFNPEQHRYSATASSNLRKGPIRTMPPSRNKDFVGRIDDMCKIDRELSKQGQVCVLSGVQGLGKSAIAAEYTYRFESAYSYIFWVQAETPMLCAEAYSQIAIRCVCENDVPVEQDRLIMLSREFLEQTKERWLLVFDNVDQWLDLQRFLPSNLLDTHGSVLITTHKTDLGRLPSSVKHSEIKLGVLSLEESRRLLLSSTQPSLSQADLKLHPEYKLAGDIAKLAERLPLALSLIAGYVLVSECSLSDFVELWNERRKNATISSHYQEDVSSEADRALETVWGIGLREVTTDARELLNILAFLDSDGIQKGLLVGAHEDPLLEMLHSSEGFRYKRMTKELSRRRLIQIEMREGEEVLSIHRKLQFKMLQELNRNAQQRERVFTQAFLLVRGRFPSSSPIQVPEPDKWPTCRKYLPHVLSLRKLYMEPFVQITPSIELAQLFSDGGIDLWERGLTSEGLDLLMTAETILNQSNSQEDLLRANIHVIVSLLLQDSGLAHIAECKDRIKTALQIREDFRQRSELTYTRNDEILLYNAWSDYGCVLLQFNNFQDAEPMFAQCFEKYKSWGPPSSIPYEYAKYYHHMAFCRMYRRDFAAAVALAEQGLHWVKEATGQSAATNRWKFDLACVVIQSGDLPKALQLHKEVLGARMVQHGKFGFLTLQSHYAVGAVQDYLGDRATAEISMRKVLDLERAREGSCPEAAIARTQFHLSQILLEQGKDLQEADTLARTARQALEKPQSLDKLKDVPKEHELALFDHLQPIFDGRFTGSSILGYLAEDATLSNATS